MYNKKMQKTLELEIIDCKRRIKELAPIIELDEEKSKEYNKIIVKKAILIDKYKKICFRPTLGQRIKKVFQLNRINKKEKLICDYFLK